MKCRYCLAPLTLDMTYIKGRPNTWLSNNGAYSFCEKTPIKDALGSRFHEPIRDKEDVIKRLLTEVDSL